MSTATTYTIYIKITSEKGDINSVIQQISVRRRETDSSLSSLTINSVNTNPLTVTDGTIQIKPIASASILPTIYYNLTNSFTSSTELDNDTNNDITLTQTGSNTIYIYSVAEAGLDSNDGLDERPSGSINSSTDFTGHPSYMSIYTREVILSTPTILQNGSTYRIRNVALSSRTLTIHPTGQYAYNTLACHTGANDHSAGSNPSYYYDTYVVSIDTSTDPHQYQFKNSTSNVYLGNNGSGAGGIKTKSPEVMVNWGNKFTLTLYSGNQYKIHTTNSSNTDYRLGVDPNGYSGSYGVNDGKGSIDPVYYQQDNFGINYELWTFEVV